MSGGQVVGSGAGMFVTGTQPLGMNLNGVSYFSSELPFMNFMNAAGGNQTFTGWFAATSGGSFNSTGEEAYIPLDSDGFPTATTFAGKTFTVVGTLINYNIGAVAPGATTKYPSGTYRVKFTGTGTIQMGVDVDANSVTYVSGTGFSISGNSFTSTGTGTYAFTFTVTTPTTGIVLSITSTGTSPNYIRAISVILNSNATVFDAGGNASYFNPAFVAAMQKFSCFRFMDWLQTNNELCSGFNITQSSTTLGGVAITGTAGQFSCTATTLTVGQPITISGTFGGTGSITGYANQTIYVISATNGTTTFTLTAVGGGVLTTTAGTPSGLTYTLGIPPGATSMTIPTWTRPTVTKTGYFNTGESRAITLTLGSPTVTWSGGLTNGVAFAHTYIDQISISFHDIWANRPLLSNCFWNLPDVGGAPYEVCMALCNLINAEMWLNIPLYASTSYITSLNTLVQANLNAGLKYRCELSNEVWNGAFKQNSAAEFLACNVFPAQGTQPTFTGNTNWFGYMTAVMANQCSIDWGGAFGRCIPTLGAWAAVTSRTTVALAAAYWSSPINGLSGPPSNYPIKAVAIAPYFGNGGPSQADATTILAELDGGYSYFFQCLTSNVMVGGSSPGTLASVPVGGWLGQAAGWESNHVSTMTAYPSMNLVGYESGQSFYGNVSGYSGSITNTFWGTGPITTFWGNLVIGANRDTRMLSQYLAYYNNWNSAVGKTSANTICHFNDVGQAGPGGVFGALESIMQTLTPLSSAPPKWQALHEYIGA